MTAQYKSVPGNQPQGKEMKTLSTGNGVRRTQSSGVEAGLSKREGFDSDAVEAQPDQNFNVDSVTGMAPERLNPREAKSVKGKDGSFWLIG